MNILFNSTLHVIDSNEKKHQTLKSMSDYWFKNVDYKNIIKCVDFSYNSQTPYNYSSVKLIPYKKNVLLIHKWDYDVLAGAEFFYGQCIGVFHKKCNNSNFEKLAIEYNNSLPKYSLFGDDKLIVDNITYESAIICVKAFIEPQINNLFDGLIEHEYKNESIQASVSVVDESITFITNNQMYKQFKIIKK